MARRARSDINLLRLAELLQEHITPALCHAVFGRVRKTERQRVWTLTALVQFWVAVILRAPKALSQALADALGEREPLFPPVAATPEAFFQRCRDLRPAFFAEVSDRFTARVLTAVPPRYAAEMAEVQGRFPALVVLDGSRLAAIARRLKLLWDERAVVLSGCLLGVYDLGRGLCRALVFDADAAASELKRAVAALDRLARDTLVFETLLWWGTVHAERALADLVKDGDFRSAAETVRARGAELERFAATTAPQAVRRLLEDLAQVAADLTRRPAPRDVVDGLLRRHSRVQAGKIDGGAAKQDWLTLAPGDRVVRPAARYQRLKRPARATGNRLTHPYRLEEFIGMLRENGALDAGSAAAR